MGKKLTVDKESGSISIRETFDEYAMSPDGKTKSKEHQSRGWNTRNPVVAEKLLPTVHTKESQMSKGDLRVIKDMADAHRKEQRKLHGRKK